MEAKGAQKKRVVLFSLAYFPKHVGGAEVAIKEITDRCQQEAYEFHLICNRYDSTLPKVEQIGNVLVHRIGITVQNPSMAQLRTFPLHLNKVLYQFLAPAYAAKLHKEQPFDGMWAMMAHATGVAAARFKSACPAVPYVLTLQEGDPPEEIERKMRFFGHWFARAFTKADMVQVISTFLGKWAERMGYQGTPVLIPNAVNTKHFSQPISVDKRTSIEAKIGKQAGDTFLVTTSRLVQKNAVDDVIRALPALPESVKFLIYGTGPDEAMLKALAHELGVASRVHFAGHIEHSDMPVHLQACDIFIRPSRSEGMGNSFLEAMAAGLPVIATQEGGIADFLFDAKRNPEIPATGWAVDSNAPAQITAAIETIMANPEAVASTTARAQAMVLKHYDWDLIARRMQQEVFSKIMC